MWPVCCPTWESSPRAQSTRGGITTEVALYIVDRGSRWSVVRSVVTNAGYHGNRAGESLQNLVTLARGRCSSSFENNGCEIPCVFAAAILLPGGQEVRARRRGTENWHFAAFRYQNLAGPVRGPALVSAPDACPAISKRQLACSHGTDPSRG
jgi:hypothetical protein